MEEDEQFINVGLLVNQDEEEEGEIRQPSAIFEGSREYFNQCHQILAIYTSLKFIASLTLIVLEQTLSYCHNYPPPGDEIWGSNYLKLWMYSSMIHSLLATLYYLKLLNLTGNKRQMIRIAIELNHCLSIKVPQGIEESQVEDFIELQRVQQNLELQQRMEQEGQLEESRRISLLAIEIKKKIFDHSYKTNFLGKVCFTVFQMLQFWGLVFYFTNYSANIEGCYNLFGDYLFIVVFMGIYQYLEIYIMTLLIIIFLPLLLFYSAYEWCKNYLDKRRERRRIESALTESIFSLQGVQTDDDECAICMEKYENQDKLVTLSCSNKHHFHASCIKSWLEVNNKCPLCRIDVLSEE